MTRKPERALSHPKFTTLWRCDMAFIPCDSLALEGCTCGLHPGCQSTFLLFCHIRILTSVNMLLHACHLPLHAFRLAPKLICRQVISLMHACQQASVCMPTEQHACLTDFCMHADRAACMSNRSLYACQQSCMHWCTVKGGKDRRSERHKEAVKAATPVEVQHAVRHSLDDGGLLRVVEVCKPHAVCQSQRLL